MVWFCTRVKLYHEHVECLRMSPVSQLFSTLLASPLLLPTYHSCNNPPRLCLSNPGFTLEQESRFCKHCVIDIRFLQEDLSVLPIAFRIKSDPFPQLSRMFVICLPLGSYSLSPAHVLPGLVCSQPCTFTRPTCSGTQPTPCSLLWPSFASSKRLSCIWVRDAIEGVPALKGGWGGSIRDPFPLSHYIWIQGVSQAF